MPRRAVIVCLGPVARALLDQVAAAVKEAYAIEIELGPPQQKPQYAFNKDRNQFHSTAILRRLVQVRPADGAPVLGLADVDLFVPDVAFVFGEADRDAMTAVVGLGRLHEQFNGRPADPSRLRRRACVEAVHELGHLMGLSHCDDARCVMFLSQTVNDSDRKGPSLCASCRAALGPIEAR